jgi:Phosphotransferase enzyme family
MNNRFTNEATTEYGKEAARLCGLDVESCVPQECLRNKHDRLVFRVRCRGLDSPSVIVKSAGTDGTTIERQLYEAVLPRLSVRTPRFFGSVESSGRRWLILEDVGNWQPSWNDACRRDLASWIAKMHIEISQTSELPLLPDRGPAFFLQRLQWTGEQLRKRLSATSEDKDRKATVRALATIDSLKRRWLEIEDCCKGVQPTLVHGDLAAENLRLVQTENGPVLFVIDWEKAGWGIPVVDLARVSLNQYLETYGGSQSPCISKRLEDAAWAGTLFAVLRHNLPAKSATSLTKHASKLARVLEQRL